MHRVTRSLIEHTPRAIRPGAELLLRTVDDAFEDRVPGLAAEVAFFSLLSLPPLLLTVLAAIGVAGDALGATWQRDLIDAMRDVASVMFSADTIDGTIDPLLDALIAENSGSLVGLGLLLTFVSASRALRVVSTAITIAYDLEATRPGWQQRLWGAVLTLGAIVTGVALVPLLIAGPGFGETVASWLGDAPGVAEAWRLGYWPAAVILLTTLVAALFHFAAPWWTPFRRDLPGAALAMALWLLGSFGLRVYVRTTIGGDAIYQPIAGPLVVLLWLYVSGFVILLGAEFNAEIERMWPTREHRPPSRRHGRQRELERRSRPAAGDDLDPRPVGGQDVGRQ